jgi:hypothetical protein
MENYTFALGFIPIEMFLYMFFFAIIGVFLALLADSLKRNKESKNTPEKYSIIFLIKDNWKTITLTILLILVSLRFAGSLFPTQFTDADLASPVGKEKWLFGSLIIGFMYNTLLQVLKQKSDMLKAKR